MNWFSLHKRKLIFFIVFFLICGSSSIWMSFLFLEVGLKDITIGLITIAIASVCASAEKVLEIVRTQQQIDNEDIIGLAAVVIPLLISIIVVGVLKKSEAFACGLSIIVYVSYCGLWWYQNRDNKTLEENSNVLGGAVEQFKK